MEEALESALFQRWPAIFRGRGKPLTETLMVWGCSHGDGWYAILDALCEVLTWHAKDLGRLPPEALQVKEKWAGLRFYTLGASDDFDHGAITMAEALSFRICEVSGWPGRMCSREGLFYATLSPSIPPPALFLPPSPYAQPPRPP